MASPAMANANAGGQHPQDPSPVSMSDHVILPPPSALNPIPSLQAALRIDNRERFLEVLATNPTTPSNGIGIADDLNASPFRQLLVFGKESLRTLLMRQVLQDPHARTFGKTSSKSSKSKSKTNKNWDDSKTFPLPKILQTNVVGTKVLLKKKNGNGCIGNDNDLGHQRGRTYWNGKAHEFKGSSSINNAETSSKAKSKASKASADYDEDLFLSPDDLFEHVDVITYLIRPWDLDQTLAVIARIKNCALDSNGGASGRTHKQHHRIVYVPRVTAMCTQILIDHKIWNPNDRSPQNNLGVASSSSSSSSSSSAFVSQSCVSVVGLQLDLFPLGSDLLSLEYEDGLREAGAVGGVPSGMIETTSRALSKLQDVVGTIPRIQALGIWGEEVLEKLLNVTVDDHWAARREDGGEDDAAEPWDEEEEKYESIDDADTGYANKGSAMVLIDRRLDMVTPMVTPLTYEGLLDELVGIESGHIEIPEGVINPPDQEEEESKGDGGSNNNPFDSPSKNPFDDKTAKTKNASSTKTRASLGVHEGDTLFAEVRDQHVEKFGSFLQNQAIALKESHANFTSKETKKDLDEIEKFVKQIPIFTQSLRSLTNHIHLAELIKATTEDVSFRNKWNTERAMIEGENCYDFLEECIFEDHNPYKVLRLICLQSLTSGGIKASKYDQFKQYIVQVYGYEFLPVLHDLETMGWIKKMEGNLATNFVMDNSSRSLFQNLKRNMILIHAEVNTVEPDDVSYASSGYAPLTVRLVQSAMQGWKTPDKEDVLKDLFQMMVSSNNCSSTNPSYPVGGGGRLLDVKQSHPPRDLPTTLRHQKERPSGQNSQLSLGAYGKAYKVAHNTKPTLIVVYLGGITYMEIASLRFLSKKETFPYHIIVVTTKILNGSKLLQQMGQ